MFKRLPRSAMHGYQNRMVTYTCERKGAGLFLEVGMGKSIISLTAIVDLMDDYCAINRVLIIAPIRVCQNTWVQEADKWEHTHHLRIVRCIGHYKERIAGLHSDADIYLINPENVPHMVSVFNTKRRWKWDMVILDESHLFKNPSSKRFRALRKMIPYITHRLLLTGTPAGNSIGDLWSQVFFLDQGKRLFRTLGMFRGMYMRSAGYMGRDWKPQKGSDLIVREKVKDITTSLLARDYLKLPKRITVNRIVTLPDNIIEQCDELEEELIAIFNGEVIESANAMTTGIKLRQLMNGRVYNEAGDVVRVHSEKLDSLVDLLEDQPNERFILCYQFKHDVKQILEALPFARLMDKRGDIIKEWNEKKIRLLLINDASAGAGINLQYGGANMVWFGLNFNLTNYIQTCGRIDRQGQTETVRIIHLLAKGTIEQKIASALKQKASTQAELMNYLKHVNKT